MMRHLCGGIAPVPVPRISQPKISCLEIIQAKLMESRGFEPLKVSFKVKSELKALNKVLYDFEQVNQPWISRKDWLQCQLALAEGFTNAVRHAHKGLSHDLLIEIEITLTQGQMEMRIWDYGNPFDLEEFLKQNVGKNNRWSGHGQGLPIIQQIADCLSYIRTDQNRNCLIITKHFFSEQQKP